MPKKLIQTKLSFSRKSPGKPYSLGRSQSDGSVGHSSDMSYADVTRPGSGRGRGKSGRGSTNNSGHHHHRGRGFKSQSSDPSSYHGAPGRPQTAYSISSGEIGVGAWQTSSAVSAPSAQIMSRVTSPYNSNPKLRRAPECYQNNPLTSIKDKNDRFHRVLFTIPDGDILGAPLSPFPNTYTEPLSVQVKANDEYVFMPCSPSNLIPGPNGTPISRWERIEEVLCQPIPGVFELEEAILSYNQQYAKRWSFGTLHDFFLLNKERKDKFFSSTLPFIKRLALKLPLLVTQPVPMLKQHRETKITMSQEQAACLLANAFFCTFPKRNARMWNSPLTDINFSNLYSGHTRDDRKNDAERKAEKLKCIVHYFERLQEEIPRGTLTFARHVLTQEEKPNWSTCKQTLADLVVRDQGTIEDDGAGMLQADFANKRVGGGVLGHGLVQEEIRFVICPEMIISRLFTQTLTDSEVLIMTGCERFSSYTGYSNTFKFDGDYRDKTSRDSWGRRQTEVVAMDALNFRHYDSQFQSDNLGRELNKAFCAFRCKERAGNLSAVATGNWGCGAFGGDKHLKGLIQLMAASVAGRQVCYFTFQEQQLGEELRKVHRQLCEYNISICEIYRQISDYRHELRKVKFTRPSLFEFIMSQLGGSLTGGSAATLERSPGRSPSSAYTDQDFGSMDSEMSESWQVVDDRSEGAYKDSDDNAGSQSFESFDVIPGTP